MLSAVQGLQVKAGINQDAVIGITCAILVVLFSVQYRGTQDIGVLFAPIVLLWFLSNVMVAIYNIATFEGGAIFRALSPHYIGEQESHVISIILSRMMSQKSSVYLKGDTSERRMLLLQHNLQQAIVIRVKLSLVP